MNKNEETREEQLIGWALWLHRRYKYTHGNLDRIHLETFFKNTLPLCENKEDKNG